MRIDEISKREEARIIARIKKYGGFYLMSIPRAYMTDAVKLAAVQTDGQAIQYIQDPSEELKLAAVQQDGFALGHIKNPSIAVQIAAIKKDNRVIKFAPNTVVFKYPELKHSILKNIISCIKSDNIHEAKAIVADLRKKRVNWPDLDAIERSFNADNISEAKTPYNINAASEEEQLAAIAKNYGIIQDIDNPSEAVQLAAVNRYPGSIIAIENPTERVKMAAIEKSPHLIKHIPDPSEELQFAAVSQDYKLIKNIYRPTPAVQRYVVEETPEYIRYINDPSEEVQLLAVSASPWNIQDIREPTTAVQKLAVIGNSSTMVEIRCDIDRAIFNDSKVKQSIIREMLKMIQHSNKQWLVRYMEILEYYDVKWPDLDVIRDTVNSMEDDDY